ncbi:MAG TPA: VWA domain-containing protein [Terracidiphilus sp.]|jgi:VWFA-related protein
MFPRTRLVQLALLGCLAPAQLISQAPASAAQEPAPTVKSEARAVVVDVLVTNGSNDPVTGLHQQDFEVNEDGHPQSVVFFEEHKPQIIKPVDLVPMPPNVFTNVPSVPPTDTVNILLLDGLNTPREEQSFVREQVIKFVGSMPAGTPLAVFTLVSSLQMVQGFTTDRTALLASLQDKKHGVWPETTAVSRAWQDDYDDAHELDKMSMMQRSASDIASNARLQQGFKSYEGDQRVEMSAEALENLARYLARIPGRKNLFWFSSRFPISFFPVAGSKTEVQVAQAASGLGAHPGSTPPPTPRPKESAQIAQQSGLLKQTADLLTGSRIAVYPVGARGVETTISGDAQEESGAISLAGLAREQREIGSNYGVMAALASETGGQVIQNSNDLSGAVAHTIDNASHYYTISYTPTNNTMDGNFRSIQIKLAGSPYKLSYRQGYYALDSTTPQPRAKSKMKKVSTAEAEADANPLQPLMERGAPSSSEILFAVRVEPANPQPDRGAERAGDNAKLAGPTTRYTVDFLIQTKDLHLETAPNGNHQGRVELELLAYDRDGKALNWTGNTTNFNLRPATYATIEKSGMHAQMEIDIPQGEAWLSSGVYDWKAGKAGTLEIPLSSLKTETAAK